MKGIDVMKMHDKFIETYKELESAVRNEFESVRAYEESLPDEDAKKLQICRIIRNYIQHNADYEKFISISSDMQSFLESHVYKLRCLNGILKDAMLSVAKYGCLFDETESVVNAAGILAKKKRDSGIVIDKKGEIIGVLTKSLISDLTGEKAITASTKISKIVSRLDTDYTLKFYPATTPMDVVIHDVESNPSVIIIITNKTGTIVGFYNV